jgi:hypothetical protein
MPIKTKKSATQNRTAASVAPATNPAESDSYLPEEVALEYDVGKIIGDGNFAVVRECLHRLLQIENKFGLVKIMFKFDYVF